MAKKDIEELKKIYPQIWERICKEFEGEKARKKAFLAMVEFKKAKVTERVEREKIRKRRTRALILFASSVIRKTESEELKQLVELVRSELFAKEGKQTVDYLPFLIEEIKAVKGDFEFEPETEEEPEPEEPETEKEPETEEEAVAEREELKKELEKRFQEVTQQVLQNQQD